jgi:ubiquinol-cytochrome c reductase cytochrome b subunit
MQKIISKFLNWFDYRWPFKPIIRWTLEEEIPGGDSFWYSFGATTLVVFIIQVVTGIWQLFYYVPTVDHAYQSVSYLRFQVSFGWLIHGLHYWGSNAFIVMVFVHMIRVFVWGAYKAPRQLTWLVGVLLLLLVLAMSFTGALLPWDELGYWAAEVGTSIAGTAPIIGPFIKEFIRGGSSMDQLTLSRFFVAHVAILPGILAGLIAFHVVAFRQFKSVGPWNDEKRKKIGYFWPQQILKDLIIISLLFIVLVGLSSFWRAPVTGPADPLDNTTTPKPEGQFLFLYQFLKLFKGRLEPVGTVGVPLVLFLILFFLPFYDRNKNRNPLYRPVAMLGCFALIVWFVIYTALGYYSNPGVSLTAKVTVSFQASASVQAGAKLFTSQGCIACHTVHGQGGDIGPNLSDIGAKGLSDQWLTTQIRNPKAHDSSSQMPAFDQLTDERIKNLVDFLQNLGGSPSTPQSSGSSSQPTQKNESSQESISPQEPNVSPATTVNHPNELSDSSQNQNQTNQVASLIAEGKTLYNSQGCSGCHVIDGKGGSVGPDLSDVGSKGLSKQWLMVQLKDPKKHDTTNVMPSYSSLSDQKLDALVTYLENLKGASGKTTSSQSSGSAAKAAVTSQSSISTQQAQPAAEPNATPAKTSSTSDPSGSSQSQDNLLVNKGKSLFDSLGCINCHIIDGKGGNIGPNLSNIGSRVLPRQWLMVQLKNPKVHNPGSIMPSFSSLSEQKLDALVAYLESLKSSRSQQKVSLSSIPSTESAPTQSSSPPSSDQSSQSSQSPQLSTSLTEPNSTVAVESLAVGEAAYLIGNPLHGEKLYKKNCSKCHGEDGKGGISNQGSVQGEIPPLNPISERLFSHNPEIFAENIDRYIQHGSMPKGPNPQQTMPAFGDNLKLTQQMICEIEAYILKLNDVDRAMIIHPGLQPYAFFALTIGGYAIAVFIIVLLWIRLKNRVSLVQASEPQQKKSINLTDKKLPTQQNETETDEQKQIESGQTRFQSEKNLNDNSSSVVFALVVIVVIVIIATAVMLIFSSFVTTKPIPSITTQHISSLTESPSEAASPSTNQRINNQQKENEK